MGDTAILELSLGFCAAVMHPALGFNFKMRESEYRIAMAEGMIGHANCVLVFQNVQFNDSMKLCRSNEILRFVGSEAFALDDVAAVARLPCAFAASVPANFLQSLHLHRSPSDACSHPFFSHAASSGLNCGFA